MDSILKGIDLNQRCILTKEYKSYVSKILFVLLFLAIILSCLAYFNLTKVQLLIFGGVVLFASLFVFYGIKKIATFSVQNDVVIVEPFFSKAYIIPVEMVKSAKSTELLILNYSRIKFKLDGVSRRYIGFGSNGTLQENEVSVEELIQTLKKRKKGKS